MRPSPRTADPETVTSETAQRLLTSLCNLQAGGNPWEALITAQRNRTWIDLIVADISTKQHAAMLQDLARLSMNASQVRGLLRASNRVPTMPY